MAISDNVRVRPERYSIIPVPNPFVVPGGRFREIYYWDSFFIIKGLLASRMYVTVRGMIENMQYLIEEFGFVPNGNRIYYLNRSQPPLLTWCVHAYYMATNDLVFVEKLLPTLRKEMAFFQTNRSIIMEGWPGPLYRYYVVVDSPRPESYREDIESAAHLHEEADKLKVWGDIAAAAESGRDFSSRWFSQTGPMAGKLEGTRTSEIVPVDLNAIICGNLLLMGDLYDAIGDIDGSK
ncbi:alpha,alpha-trehalase, partial [Ancylostoma duodenale]